MSANKVIIGSSPSLIESSSASPLLPKTELKEELKSDAVTLPGDRFAVTRTMLLLVVGILGLFAVVLLFTPLYEIIVMSFNDCVPFYRSGKFQYYKCNPTVTSPHTQAPPKMY